MSLDIKTSTLEPRRRSFANIVRRKGVDKPATRYEEAVLDVQPTANFHYRPLWAPDFELYDVRRTQIVMEDWYALSDPRQLYYATYTISRAAMNASNDKNFEFVSSRDLFTQISAEWKEKIGRYLVPFRHYEWGANMNSCFVTDFGFGTAITSASAFAAMDRLGMAQILSEIGLLLDDATGMSLEVGKKHWLEDEAWQPTRHALEDLFVVEDWFETFVAQNFVFDGILHPLVFRELDREGGTHGAMGISLTTEFMVSWFADQSRWVDFVIKRSAEESEANAELIRGWVAKWTPRALEAASGIAGMAVDENDALVSRLEAELAERATKLGIGG